MKHKTTIETLDDFLAKAGAFAENMEVDIDALKKEYWRQYRKKWKQQKRHSCKAFEILLNPKELHIISNQAAINTMSITSYIKTSALSQHLTTNPKLMGEVRELIMIHTTFIHQQHSNLAAPVLQQLLQQSINLEQKIVNLFLTLQSTK